MVILVPVGDKGCFSSHRGTNGWIVAYARSAYWYDRPTCLNEVDTRRSFATGRQELCNFMDALATAEVPETVLSMSKEQTNPVPVRP